MDNEELKQRVVIEAFIALINADHHDIIEIGRTDGCLMRDYIRGLEVKVKSHEL